MLPADQKLTGTGGTLPLPAALARPGILETVICALTFLAYVGTLAFGFVYDDQPVIVKNAVIHSWQYLPHYFLPNIGSDLPAEIVGAAGTFYRPLTLLWMRTNHALFGLNPAGWHLAALALHVLVTYLVFRLALRLTKDRSVAFVAGILFGLHPAHVENVAWVSAVNDLLVAALLLGGFLAFLQRRDAGRNVWLGISLALFGLALLAKETAVVLPLLIFAYAAIVAQPAGTPRSWRTALAAGVRESWAYFCLLALYAITRLAMFHSLPQAFTPLSWKTMFLTWPSVLWFDLKHLALPIRTSEFYSLPYVTAISQRAFVLPMLCLFATAVVAILWIPRLRPSRVACFAAVWVLVPLLPTLYLRAIATGDFVHDRFLYLPSAGVVILAALTLCELPRLLPWLRPAKRQWALVVLLAAACLWGTLSNQLQWGSDLLLYQRGIQSAPDNISIRDNFGNALVSRGEFNYAIPVYLEVLRRDPRFWRSNYNLGYAYYRIGDFPRAAAYLGRAISIDGQDPDQFIYLAYVQMKLGRLDDAEQNARQAIGRKPSSPGYHYVLALILEAKGNRPQAISELQRELQNDPQNAAARNELTKLTADRP